MTITEVNKPVLVRREVTRHGRVGDLFTACLADDALWEDDRICQCDFVICTKPYASCGPIEVSGLQYKLMAKEHNSKLGTSFKLNFNEKRYLSEVIGPFRDQVTTIVKVKSTARDEEYILIKCKRDCDWTTLPNFKRGTKYKGMEMGINYTLAELGL